MAYNICYWRGVCNKLAVGQVAMERNLRNGTTNRDDPVIVGRYCGEHLLLFSNLGKRGQSSMWVEYDKPTHTDDGDRRDDSS